MSYRKLAYLPDRRSTRIEQSVHITVRGFDSSGTSYVEKASTLAVSCHGCRYLSRNNVLRGSIATLEVVNQRDGRAAYSTQIRVISVRQLATEMLFDVAVELESPRNIWDIASPPDDWSELPEAPTSVGSAQALHIVRRTEEPKVSDSRWEPAETTKPSFSVRTNVISSLPPLLAQLAASLHEPIGTAPPEAARPNIVEDHGQPVGEFRAQLKNEAVKVFECLLTVFADEMARRAQKLIETHEAAARETAS